MPKSTATCNSILALIFNATAWADIAENDTSSPAGNLYLSLHTASPGVGNNQTTNETAYTNYARIAVVRTASGWDVPSGGATANAALAQAITGRALTPRVAHYGPLRDAQGERAYPIDQVARLRLLKRLLENLNLAALEHATEANLKADRESKIIS